MYAVCSTRIQKLSQDAARKNGEVTGASTDAETDNSSEGPVSLNARFAGRFRGGRLEREAKYLVGRTHNYVSA
jgi:hypothetical protein